MRRLVAPFLMLLFVFGNALPALAEEPSIQVTLAGEQLSFDVPPFISNGRTLVPVRVLAEALGFAVEYDDPERRVTLTRGEEIILLWIDSDQVVVNGVPGTIDQPATLREKRTFVPVRFVSESLGAHVDWNPVTWTVVISHENPHQALLTRATQQLDLMLDQTSIGEIIVQIDLLDPNGASMVTMKMPIGIETQIFQNEMLQTMSITPPLLLGLEPQVTLMAIKDNVLYMKTPEDTQWQVITTIDGDGVVDLKEIEALNGLQASMLLQADMLAESTVTAVGSQEIDGVTVTGLKVVMPTTGSGDMFKTLMGALGGEMGAEAGADFDLELFEMTYWVDPLTAFTHQMELNMVLTLTVDMDGAPMAMRLTMDGLFNYVPGSGPIDFLDL